ncbi:hypothetical protein [Psychrobacillus sp. MER TA 171]|uniref:hypothetical protein n=1 Tax=Psychrobacillus sp. MER TA 171 TaxID=2939577 RepID=UPI00203C7C03|nr:hypothetical protein [Psychrobacillus sp. MER TA 171]MCM3359339.1 hypothetical protein [Psychrobacillus sp. MER TA 171]
MSIILGDFTEVELGQASRLQSVEKLVEINGEQGSFVMDATEKNLRALEKSGYNIFIPADLLSYVNEDSDAKVYFELECYPFYKKIKEVIENGSKANGVFRFRRMVREYNLDIMAGDLYVLSLLFGEPKVRQIKRSKRDSGISHMILMIRFESGAMAHVEFTIANVERVEVEWSGVKRIVEFDSEELNGQLLPLQYNADDVMRSAKKVDAVLIEKVKFYRDFIAGGTLI